MRSSMTTTIADVQNSHDSRNIAIDQVGIKALRHPIAVLDRHGERQNTIATFDMFVFLPHHFKGTHMSRFVEILNQQQQALSMETFETMCRQMIAKLDADSGLIQMHFPYFINKVAPISGVPSLMDYDITWVANINEGRYQQTLKVLVPVTSLCPCSKKIADYGAHNQRSHVTATVSLNAPIWIEDLVAWIEQQASCELYGLLKRPDEKYVTERAYDNPRFVEDMVRDIAAMFNNEARIDSYVVESENFESIHNHSAYALVKKDKHRSCTQ